jgi:hypothetical protein
MRISTILRLMAGGAVLWTAARVMRSEENASGLRGRHAAIDPRDPAADRAQGAGAVRSAGPEGMRSDCDAEWDKIDQAADESFPASDPPSR